MNEPKIEEKKRRGRKTEQQKTMKSNIHQMKHMDEKVIRQSHLFETAIVFAKLQCIRSLANKRIYTNKIFVVFSFFFFENAENAIRLFIIIMKMHYRAGRRDTKKKTFPSGQLDHEKSSWFRCGYWRWFYKYEIYYHWNISYNGHTTQSAM